jgi:hypothetical protein
MASWIEASNPRGSMSRAEGLAVSVVLILFLRNELCAAALEVRIFGPESSNALEAE